MLEAVHRYRRKVMVTSASEIYGKNSSTNLRETDDRILRSPSVARWAYSTSKAVDEILDEVITEASRAPTPTH